MGKLTRRAIVLAALCVGLLAALLAYLFLNQEKVQAAKMTEPVQVVITTEAIPARTMIEPSMVREAMRPVATLPTNSATSVREVLGQVTTVALKADSPVERAAIAAPNASLGLAYVVPEGMRAVTVALDPIIGVAGFLKAGDHVDVLATFEVDKVAVTKTVLQDVELLAIGPDVVPQQVKSDNSNNARPKEQPNATLSLYPGDAEKLILAESQGKLRLTLRSQGDSVKVVLAGIRSDSLTGMSPSRGAGAAAPRPAPAARIMPAGYTSPAFYGNYPTLGSSMFRGQIGESRPQSVSLGERVKIAPSALDQPVTVETVRGTKAETVDVKPE